jgi:hypothetical protein
MKTTTNTTLANCRDTLRRRIKRQFLRSLTPEQREMYVATTTPIQNRRIEYALENLIASMDFEFPDGDERE